MSVELLVYLPELDDALIPRWIERLNELDMICDIHPDFTFKQVGGFLPFRVVLKKPLRPELGGKAFLTGFELYLDVFSLADEIAALTPRPSFWDKLRGKKPKPVFFASPEVDQKLASCTRALTFSWGTADMLELRMAALSALILAEVTGGICYDPEADTWISGKDAIIEELKEVEAFEASLKPEEVQLHPFEEWL